MGKVGMELKAWLRGAEGGTGNPGVGESGSPGEGQSGQKLEAYSCK